MGKKMMVLFGLIAILGANAFSQEVQPTLQAALFKKIFSLDKTLAGKTSIEVVVIGGADDIIAALNSAGMKAKPGSAAGGDVVYVASGGTPPKAAAAKAGILTVSGDPVFAEKGLVSIAIGIVDGKPKIYVNLGQLKAEKHELSADLLKLAKIIQ